MSDPVPVFLPRSSVQRLIDAPIASGRRCIRAAVRERSDLHLEQTPPEVEPTLDEGFLQRSGSERGAAALDTLGLAPGSGEQQRVHDELCSAAEGQSRGLPAVRLCVAERQNRNKEENRMAAGAMRIGDLAFADACGGRGR